ncbi:MAG: FAD:protein FMN transferase [Bdellovibrionales bacterium]|jgi:thiamine biosynthesis lipoprotein|nr:FAD:protein FMN transferase [Bdellovibrionales bacterium]
MNLARISLLCLVAAALLLFFGVQRTVAATSAEYLECGDRAEMGTPFKMCVVIQREQQEKARADIATALGEARRINNWMSEWMPETELSKVNQAAGLKPVEVSRELFRILRDALVVAKESNGAFDPTFNAFWGLYSFKKGQEREPTEKEIKERLPLVNWRAVVLDEGKSTVFLKEKGMKLGLGAVGKGYAADIAAEKLKALGYKGGYADGSGDTVFWGKKPGGAEWTTGVRDPYDNEKAILRIYGTDFSITTSGDDEKYFFKDGRRVHHILDTKTGRSASRSRQATIIAKKGVDADTWSTTAFVLGPEAAMPLIEKHGFRAVLIGADGKVHISKGLEKRSTPWGDGYVVVGELR